MSEWNDRIAADLKEAMRAREKDRVATLRMIISDLKNAGIEKKGREGFTEEVDSPAEYLTDQECQQVLRSALKRRKEAIEQYEAGNRLDLVEKEQREADIIKNYLPRPLDAAELEALVEEAIAEIGANSAAQMGQVMKVLMPKVDGRADGKAVSAAVKQKLT